ncbi:MAG: transcriptional repressor [Acidobacteriia bacterium]|nr:transcriptional repressor [Terriglobia bacterium]
MNTARVLDISEVNKAQGTIPVTEEKRVFEEHLRTVGLKHSHQRDVILDEFLKHRTHLSVDDLYQMARQRDARIGFSTVFRTMKLLKDCGVAREVVLADGISRFERNYKYPHHDHLICTSCNKTVEFFVSEIEELQEQVARKYHFKMKHHVMVLYGLCRDCQRALKT